MVEGLRSVLLLWGLALALSAILVLCGHRWPDPLVVQPALVWGLLLGPPGLMTLWLLGQWRNADEGESQD